MSSYLIAYYSKTGTTREIAEEIADHLSRSGHSATVIPGQEVQDISPYSHVILGAPVNGMQWVPEAKEFLAAHASALAQKELSLFTVSYVMHTGWRFWRSAVTKGISELAKQYSASHTTHFRGRINGQMPAPARVIFGIPRTAAADLRDQDEVAAWTRTIA
ncbi:MAG: flavodoxin domain-containing protein [Spirochaeta sp.]